jgi:hypothetical protein
MWYCAETDQSGIFAHMLIGYMRVSTDGDRQVMDLPPATSPPPRLALIRREIVEPRGERGEGGDRRIGPAPLGRQVGRREFSTSPAAAA